jgi:3-hydroxyisobutyrate dehydrogenase
MAKNLVRAGFPVTVYNRTASRADALKEMGAGIAKSPAALLAVCDWVITMVADDEALKQIHMGENGLLMNTPAATRTLIDMSTVSPATSRQLAGQWAPKGVDYLDAPVSGSVKPAEDGQLVIMVGGERAVYEKARPIFERLGKSSFWLGPHGAGNVAKLAINLLLAFQVQGLTESVLFAKANGIGPGSMLSLINESALANGITRGKAPNIIDRDFRATFALKHLAKDLRLAREQGLRTPGGLLIEESFRKARESGLGEEDMIAILKFLENKL